ncbi:MAG TPA: sialidase family protein, partial [Rhizomicrobium sp.]
KPAPCALPNVQASSGGRAVSETPLAVNPLDPKQLMTGGMDYNCRKSLQGFWTSSDGGSTWMGGCAPLAKGASAGEGDPVVGYDLSGTAWRGGVDVLRSGQSEIVVSSSTDNGRSWSDPVVATRVPKLLSDKPWLAIDTNANSPDKNALYISSTQFDAENNSQIYVAHSTDGGTTWSAVAAAPQTVWPRVAQFSDLAIGANGTVYLSYMVCTADGKAGDCGGGAASLYFTRSADGGDTWSTPVLMASLGLDFDNCACAFFGNLTNTSEPMSEIPVIAIDNSNGAHAGELYFAAYTWTGIFMQLLVGASTDGGATWTPPVAVAPKSDRHDQFLPWIAVSANGVLGVTWLDRRNDPDNVDYEAFGAWSSDGGNNFSTNVQLASEPSNPFDDGFDGRFMGEYTGNAWSGKTLFGAWPDTRSGTATQDEAGGWRR